MDLIGGKVCHKCNIGKYHLCDLTINKHTKIKHLKYKCDKCGNIIKREFLTSKKHLQISFIEDITK